MVRAGADLPLKTSPAGELHLLGYIQEERMVTELRKRKLDFLRTKELAELLLKCDRILGGLVGPCTFLPCQWRGQGDLVNKFHRVLGHRKSCP